MKDQIEFVDILRLMWRYKYLILLGILAPGLIAGIVSIAQPKIYRISMVIQPGVIAITDEGELTYVDSPENLKAIIMQGVVRKDLIKLINAKGVNKPTGPLNFKVTIPKRTNLVKISFKTQFVEQGISILNYLPQALSIYYADTILEHGDRKIREFKDNLIILNAEEKILTDRIDVIRKVLNSNADNKADTKLNKVEYFELKSMMEDSQIRLLEVQTGKRIQSDFINLFKNQATDSSFIKVLKDPVATRKPINPKIELNIVLASFAGFFLTIFLAYLFENIKNRRNNKFNGEASGKKNGD